MMNVPFCLTPIFCAFAIPILTWSGLQWPGYLQTTGVRANTFRLKLATSRSRKARPVLHFICKLNINIKKLV